MIGYSPYSFAALNRTVTLPTQSSVSVTADTSVSTAGQLLQDELLQGVSRTFALTIPQLPEPLGLVVGNAYLLCRIVDTIEDEPTLSAADKQYFCRQFVAALQGQAAVQPFAEGLATQLSAHTLAAEHELIRQTPQVIAMTHRFNAEQRAALSHCVEVMAEGMMEFQAAGSVAGLNDCAHLDRYCYHVAGVVGEMLTRLFCDYSSAIARQRAVLMPLAVEFGQGLQMTNILKDTWDDRARGVCWLPRDVFAAHGLVLADMDPAPHPAAFSQGLEQLIGMAHGHLHSALRYTLLIPAHEVGIRRFCLWAIGMAMLTLRNINRHRDFRSAHDVKITRRAVGMTIAATRIAVRHDRLLRGLFYLLGTRLPR